MADREELLLTLLSMGFDFDRCSQLLDEGVSTIEDAVQRLLNPTSSISSVAANVGSLDISQIPNVSDQLSISAHQVTGESSKVKSRYERQRKEQADFERKEARSAELVRKKQKLEDFKVKQNVIKEIQGDRKHHKNTTDQESLLPSKKSDHSFNEKDEYEKKEREVQWKKMQAEKRTEKQRVLQQVQRDKMNRRENTTKTNVSTNNDTLAAQSGMELSKTIRSNAPQTARLQVVFPTGAVERFVLPASATLNELFDKCARQIEGDIKRDYYFLQTFPKKTFTSTQATMSILDSGLCPSAKLLLKKTEEHAQPLESAFMEPSKPSDAGVKPLESTEKVQTMEIQNESVRDDNAEHPGSSAVSQQLLAGEHQPVVSVVDENNINVDETTSGSLGESKSSPTLLSPQLTDTIPMNEQNTERRQHSRLLHGEFVNIVDDIRNVDRSCDGSQEDNDHSGLHNDRSRLFQEAIERRIIGESNQMHPTSSKERKLPTLQTLLAKFIALQLLRMEPTIIGCLHLLNPQSANIVIKTLKNMDQLTAHVLTLLKPCKLQEINLDFYRLTSLDVVLSLKVHHYLKRISLKSVTCIADRALETIVKNVPHITYLNLSQCKAVTGSFLITKLSLSKMKVLILDDTNIKNDYLRSFLRMKTSKELSELSLNNCAITDEALDIVEDYTSMQILSLNNTLINSLAFLQHFPNLVGLGLKSLKINDAEMMHVQCLNNMSWLDLQATEVYFEGLQFIKDKNLTHFSLPDRLCVNNSCLSVVEGYRLTTLDLSDYIHLDDGCMKSVCKIRTLQNLSLSNTKISDIGALEIRVLSHLEALDLSRTLVTSHVSALFVDLKYVETLNIARTKITNDFLSTLTSASLSKISLSNNHVDDEGVRLLQLPKLLTLIADGTEISGECLQQLQRNCPMICNVRNVNKGFFYAR